MQERLTTHSPASPISNLTLSQAPLFVCFSHLRWDFVWQRPQHLLSRAAKAYRVLLVEEPLYEPGIVPYMHVSSRPQGITVAVPMLPTGIDPTRAVAAQRGLVDRLLAREPEPAQVLWYYTPMALAFTSHLESDLCVYDNMDELSLFRGASQELMDLEAELFSRADVVFTGGASLYEAKRARHKNIYAFPSSIEFDHFAKARRPGGRDPRDQEAIPQPRLGFFGVIDERMNLDLVRELAALRPDWHLVMIGPTAKIDPANLPQAENIHWLGPKAYSELPHYLAHWDIGFMPFALNEATRFISPTKTPEFLAAGVPVVSTPITDVIRPYGDKGLVEIASTADEVVSRAEALLLRPKAAWLHKVDRHLAAGSWDKTWAAMHRAMLEALGGTAMPSSVPSYAITPAE